MRLLVTGAAGMLGTSLLPVLKDHDHVVHASDIRFTGHGIEHLDVRNLEALREAAKKHRPDMLIHLAAETDLEVCETRPDFAYQENFVGTQNACATCQEFGIPLVYISTAGVFDGRKPSPYTEFDTPNPINVYGASKFQGEQIVRQTMPNHFIVRAGWMIGGGERDRKFVSKIIAQLKDGKKTIYAVNDRLGTPTYAPAFSVMLEKIIGTKVYGTYHLACKGRASRFDVAAEILRILGRDEVQLKPVASDFFKEEYFAPRPYSEEMQNYILELRQMNEMPEWREALAGYLREHFSRQFR